MKRHIVAAWMFGFMQTKRFFRDPVAIFFTLLFPVLFLLVFGSIFKGGSDVSFDIALVNRSDTQFAKDFVKQAEETKVLKIDNDITSVDKAKELMGRGQLDSIIELPADFGKPAENNLPSGKLIVYYEEANPQTGQTLSSIMQQTLDGINKQLTGHVDPLSVEQKPTKTANLTQFDYTFSGLIGFTLLSMGIFGLANGLPADKKAGFLRRLRATPLRASQLIHGTLLNYGIFGLLSIALMMTLGILLFNFDMRGDWVSFVVFVLLSTVVMLGFGLAIGGWAKNEYQAAPLSNLVAFPLMFLSGTFFPRFIMPEWLQNITAYLPLTPIVDGIRYITTEGRTLFELGPELAILGVWGVVVYAIAIKIFRWE